MCERDLGSLERLGLFKKKTQKKKRRISALDVVQMIC
jgi:hypothetical protein